MMGANSDNALHQSFDVLGNDTARRAAAGDLMAQRALIAALLIPPGLGEVLSPERLVQAEHWARVAAANGGAEDAIRLVQILAWKETMINHRMLPGSSSATQVEALALLAVVADGADAGQANAAIKTLGDLMNDPLLSQSIIDGAARSLRLGRHTTPLFDALAALPRATPPASEVERRTKCFESLVAALSNAHDVDRDGAKLLITTEPGYLPEMLDSKDGWDTIFALVAERLGEPPAVITCQ